MPIYVLYMLQPPPVSENLMQFDELQYTEVLLQLHLLESARLAESCQHKLQLFFQRIATDTHVESLWCIGCI